MIRRMFQRRGLAALWDSVNPILGEGEIGIETDNFSQSPVTAPLWKIGDGVSTWQELPYMGGGGITDGDYGDVTVTSGGLTWTIKAGAVSYAKLQDASAGNVVLTRASATAGDYGETALAASQLLGRGSTGNIAAITVGTGLLMSGSTLTAVAGSGSTGLGRATTEYRVAEDMDRGLTTSGSTGTTFVTNAATPVVYTNGGSGAFASSEQGAPGIIQLSTGASSTAAPRLWPWSRNTMVLGGGEIQYDTRIRIPTLSTGTQRFEVRVGFWNAITGANRFVSCYYRDDVNSGNWRLETINSGGTTNTDTATTGPTANAWHHIRIVINAAGTSVSLYVDDMTTPVATATTNIPTGELLGLCNGMGKSIGTTSRTLDTDYCEVYQVFTSAR